MELIIKQNTTIPWIEWSVIDENRCPVDLEALGATKVTFSMIGCDRSLTPFLIESPGEFADKAKGLLRYRWTEYETLFARWYFAWFTVYFPAHVSGGKKAAASYESVAYTALEVGEDGNSISVVFDGNNTIAEAVSTWNTANPTNLVEHDAVDDTVVPTAGTVQLADGSEAITTVQKISYPDQREKLEVTVQSAYGDGTQPPGAPVPPSIEDWLNDRKRENYTPIGVIDGSNKTFTTGAYWFTMNEAFKLHLRLNGRELTRNVDYEVYSSDPTKLGYNTIIFDEDVAVPQPGDVLLCDFYISDSL